METKPRSGFAAFDPEAASLWMLIPVAAAEILIGCTLVLAAFRLRFGELPPYALGFAACLAAFQVLIIVGLRFRDRTDVHSTVTAKNDWLDTLGSLWLVACAFGALSGWACGQLADGFLTYERPLLVAEAVLTVVLPLATMLPNTRYITRKAAYIQIPILTLVTILPVLIGRPAVAKLFGL